MRILTAILILSAMAVTYLAYRRAIPPQDGTNIGLLRLSLALVELLLLGCLVDLLAPRHVLGSLLLTVGAGGIFTLTLGQGLSVLRRG